MNWLLEWQDPLLLQQRSHVPKFGNWDGEENVPYTAYFDKARKGRTGAKMINPNDPEENPDIFSDNASEARSPPKTRGEREESLGQQVKHEEYRVSRKDGDHKQVSDSPARNDNLGRRASSESTNQRQGGRGMNSGETYRRQPRSSGGSEQSIDRSPLYPQQARIAGRGTGSPSWEARGSSYDSSHSTPGRSRMRPSRGDESVSILSVVIIVAYTLIAYKTQRGLIFIQKELWQIIIVLHLFQLNSFANGLTIPLSTPGNDSISISLSLSWSSRSLIFLVFLVFVFFSIRIFKIQLGFTKLFLTKK